MLQHRLRPRRTRITEVCMPAELEKEVESYFVKRAKEEGYLAVKFVPDQKKGMPDRLLLLPRGHVVWVELKRPKGGRLSAIQKYQHQKLRSYGHVVYVVATRKEVDELFDEIEKSHDLL